jgi:hypothetical protein
MYNKKANWIGHILHRNGLLKHVIEDPIEGRSGERARKNAYAATG